MSLSVSDASTSLAERLGAVAAIATVAAASPISPNLYELTLSEVSHLAGAPGNDVMFIFDVNGQRTNRRYSVRNVDLDADTLTLWVTANHQGVGADWVTTATPGTQVEVIGPRGKILLNDHADWHVFIGDTAALGAFYRMAGAIETPSKAIFIVEVDDMNDAVTTTFDQGLGVTGIFVERNGRANEDPSGLLAGLAAFEFPEHEGHAYIFSEFNVMKSVATALRDRGLDIDHISQKAFYRTGQHNAANGEPNKD